MAYKTNQSFFMNNRGYNFRKDKSYSAEINGNPKKRKRSDTNLIVMKVATESIGCKKCKWTFTKKVGFYIHFQNCSNGSPLTCSICEISLCSMEKLFIHCFKEHKIYTERIANLATFDGDLKDRLADIAKDFALKFEKDAKANRYKCDKCPEGFKIKINHKIHEDFCKKNQNGGFKCQICDYELAHNKLMIKHYKVHHPKEVIKLYKAYGLSRIVHKCRDCLKVFTLKMDLKIHESFCLKKNKVDYFQCHFCKIKCEDNDSMIKHYKVSHPNKLSGIFKQNNEKSQKWQTCHRCKMLFKSELTYELHLETCLKSDENQFSYQCHLCHKTFENPRMDKFYDHYKKFHNKYVRTCFETIQELKKLDREENAKKIKQNESLNEDLEETLKIHIKVEIDEDALETLETYDHFAEESNESINNPSIY